MIDKPAHATRHCRHYSYVMTVKDEPQGPQCACGIDLREKPGASQVCMPPNVDLRKGEQHEPCAWREEYTDAERAAWEEFRTGCMERMVVILADPAIPSGKDRKAWGTHGTMPCPACKIGTVHWLRARSNGHLHARCSTPHCFAVMQ